MEGIRKKYQEKALPELKKSLGISNDWAAPRIKKTVVNVGVGKFLKDSAQLEDVKKSLEAITGQKALAAKSKKSIAGFKIREGLEVGLKTTLRGRRMWDFLDKFVGAALPRVKDFRGLKASCVDGSGNLNVGIKEQLIFPEISPEQAKTIFSLEVTVVTDAKSKEKGEALFRLLGFPMENKS